MSSFHHAVELPGRGRKLSSNQYDETTWSARSWMAFASQQLSVAVQLAVADEISDSYDARCLGAWRAQEVTLGGGVSLPGASACKCVGVLGLVVGWRPRG